ncbi:MAG: orotate phosphoribosyltransferase [Bacteroidales bacterium]|jgi:orotate phosphoribosyltransferase|nr:orotate phosphoribosyltransferase [Bacteroidales bacterium]
MIFNEETAYTVSDFLLQIKAIKLNNNNPFTWASGMRSPIYCDNRITLSFPTVRTYIRQQFVKAIQQEFGDVDLIAGVATGAIAQGVLVAQDMGLPFAYVRSSSKGHGLENLIEGKVEEGQSVVVVEDLVSTGGSSLKAVNALREAGCNVKGMVAIFTYQLPAAIKNFEKESCKLITLADYDSMIARALENNYINDSDFQSLSEWRNDPKKWAEKHKSN